MGLGIFVEAWNNRGIQMLVLTSLVLQLLLFILPIVRRHKMLEKRKFPARLFKLLLWLAYQLADTTAIYVLGHMAISSSSSISLPGEVMALWSSLLLVHLGGQDTITAYSQEDNRLWKRHLLTLLVQAAGVVYVLHGLGRARGGRSSGPDPRLRAASALMFVVGFLKFAERIWVLRASDMDKLYARKREGCIKDRWSTCGTECELCTHSRLNLGIKRCKRYTAPSGQDSSAERAEEDLKQAHELLFFCMGRFVDAKEFLSLTLYQEDVIKCYAREKRLGELVHLQLSLMHDLLYTKASVIHTWYGCLIRVFSWLATAITCMLVFLSGTRSSTDGVRRFDVRVTNALLAGAFLLETASSLRAAGSTWTYEILRSGGWGGLESVVLAFRRLVRAAEQSRRRRPSYIGAEWVTTICGVVVHHGWSAFGVKNPDTSLVVDQLVEMVTEYMETDHQKELVHIRGGLSLDRLLLSSGDEGNATLIQELGQLQFHDYLQLWFFATREFNESFPVSLQSDWRDSAVELSEYMIYLFMEKPHMLPSPIPAKGFSLRTGRADSAYTKLKNELLGGTQQERERKSKPLLWVWIEMLCYAASHCNRESHARELSNGSPEFTTVLWVARAALIDADMKPAGSTVAAASVRDKSLVATEGNNVITHRPSSVPPVLNTNLISNHRRVVSV